ADATILIVAQRVNTVKDAEKIIVLNDGEIAGIGTHAELLENNRIYQEIVASQQDGEVSV
ncbi:MAG TPA: ABC transporter ATP-binding protein, partial [Metabacillus sp.]|nr:ABC transporter ATP-binding protein [Metabacillus sp.]